MVRLATQEDIPFIESVINHEQVRGFMGMGDRPLTFDKTFEYALTYVSEYGVVFGEDMGDGTYVFLVAFLPEGAGMHAMLAMRHAAKLVFTTTDCHRIIGTISIDPINRRMLRAASILGFDSPRMMGGRAIISMEFQGWALQNSDCYEVGGKFMDEHDIAPQAIDMAGMVGAFLLTARHGLLSKAVKEYEAYAILSHTKPIIFSADADRLYLGDRDITEAVMAPTGA